MTSPQPSLPLKSRLASFLSAAWAEFSQIGVIRHPISLVMMLAIACGVLRIPVLQLDLMGAGLIAPPLFEAMPLVLFACTAWASIVWAQLRPDLRWFPYSLPVRHTTFLLARATAGYAWMAILLGIAIGVSLAAGDFAQLVSPRALIVGYAVGCTIAYLLVTALAIAFRFPLYVALALVAVPLGAGRVMRLQGISGADYADQFILGPKGLFTALFGFNATQSNGVFDVVPADTWAVAAIIWGAIAVVAVVVAARMAARR